MLTRTIAIIFGVATVAVLNALVSQPRNGENIEAQLTAPAEANQPAQTSTSQQVMLSGGLVELQHEPIEWKRLRLVPPRGRREDNLSTSVGAGEGQVDL